MTIIQLKHTCKTCKKSWQKDIDWIDPSKFKDPTKAIITSSFFCPYCHLIQGIKYILLPDKEVKYIEDINIKDIFCKATTAIKVDIVADPKEDMI